MCFEIYILQLSGCCTIYVIITLQIFLLLFLLIGFWSAVGVCVGVRVGVRIVIIFDVFIFAYIFFYLSFMQIWVLNTHTHVRTQTHRHEVVQHFVVFGVSVWQ